MDLLADFSFNLTMFFPLKGSCKDWCDLQTFEEANGLSAWEEVGEPSDESGR